MKTNIRQVRADLQDMLNKLLEEGAERKKIRETKQKSSPSSKDKSSKEKKEKLNREQKRKKFIEEGKQRATSAPEEYQKLHDKNPELPFGWLELIPAPWLPRKEDGSVKFIPAYTPSEEEEKALRKVKDKKRSDYDVMMGGKTVLVEGKDDKEIAEFQQMLDTIISQPSESIEARREIEFAKSILGSQSKTAANIDDLMQGLEDKDYKDKEDFSDEELAKIEENLLAEPGRVPEGYIGWKRTDQEGNTIYVLSTGQINYLSYAYENALMRIKGEDPRQARKMKREQEQEQFQQQQEQKQQWKEKLKKFKEKKKKEETLLSDDDLGDLDLEGFESDPSIAKVLKTIKTARSLIKITGNKLK